MDYPNWTQGAVTECLWAKTAVWRLKTGKRGYSPRFPVSVLKSSSASSSRWRQRNPESFHQQMTNCDAEMPSRPKKNCDPNIVV